MNNIPLQKQIAKIIKKDATYPESAYEFMTEVVHFATQNQPKDQNLSRHVGARKIVQNTVIYALQEYGYFAKEVLVQLNILNAKDIGNIIFNLIEVELLHQSEEDSLDDFMFDLNLLQALDQRYKRYAVRSDEIPILG